MCVRYLTPDKMEEVQQIIDTLGTVSIRIPENELVARKNPEVGPGVTAPIIVIGRGFDGKDAADRPTGIMISGKWGFVKWDGKGLVFNARCESLTERFLGHLAYYVECACYDYRRLLLQL